LLAYHQEQTGIELQEYILRIDGMHCGSCVRRVSQALNVGEAVNVVDVRVGAARIRSAAGLASVDLAIAALAKAGYQAHLEQ